MTHVESHAPSTVTWADLMTGDTEAARRFYGSLFDWSFDVGPPESGPYITALRGGRRIAGMGPKPPGMPTAWSVYFSVEDIEATCARITEAGGSVMVPVMDIWEHGRMAVAQDPTGAAFGLWQPKAHKGFQLETEPGAYAWTELYTRSLAAAAPFYATVFGFRTVAMAGMPYMTLHLGPSDQDAVGGIMEMDDQKLPPGAPPYWGVYLACASTDASVAKVVELGGAVMAPAFDTPHGRIAVVQDPQGGVFSLIQLPTPA
jgi:predicted enzyme related to lactoylglutathione lyase